MTQPSGCKRQKHQFPAQKHLKTGNKGFSRPFISLQASQKLLCPGYWHRYEPCRCLEDEARPVFRVQRA